MYSSIEDVRNALTPGGSSGDPATAGSLTDGQIVDAIREADSVIDAHLGLRYTIPQDVDNPEVSVIPIRYWSRNIAAFNATLTHKRNQDVGADEPVRLRYTATMALLVAIRDGKASLKLPGIDGDVGDGDGVEIFNLYDGNLFGMDDFALAPTPNPQRYVVWPSGS